MPTTVFQVGPLGICWHSRWCRHVKDHLRCSKREWNGDLKPCKHCIVLVKTENEYLECKDELAAIAERLEGIAAQLRFYGGRPDLL